MKTKNTAITDKATCRMPGLSVGEFFPVLVGAIVGVLAVVLAAKVFDKVLGTFRQPKWAGNLTLVIGAAAWVATTYALWI